MQIRSLIYRCCFLLAQGCVEKLLRLPIGLDSADVPFHYVAGTQVFGTDKRRTEVAVPWKPGNIINSTLLSRPARPQPPFTAVASGASVAAGSVLGKLAPPGTPQLTILAQYARKAPSPPQQSEVITVDLCHGDGFYARKAKMCGLVPRTAVVPCPEENLQQLLERRDVRAVANAMDKVRSGLQKEGPTVASRAEQELLQAERIGRDYAMLKAAVDDIISKIERKFKRHTTPGAAAAPTSTTLIDIDNPPR